MDERDQSWRRYLRLYLADHIDQPLRVGDLYKRFGVSAESDWKAFIICLRRYPLDMETVKGRRQFRPDTIIRPIARPCANCGKPFFGVTGAYTCNQSCGHLLSWRNKREQLAAN